MVIEFRNRTGETISLSWIDYDGRRRPWRTIPPDVDREEVSFATHPFVVADDLGRDFGTYASQGSDGVVTLTR